MAKPQFDADGRDIKTYAPFEVLNAQGALSDFIVQFHDWDWLFSTYNADVDDGSIDGYYMNGPGVEGLVKATMMTAGINADKSGISYNSEGDTCFIQFKNLDEAVRIAEIAANMIKDRKSLLAMIRAARSLGFED